MVVTCLLNQVRFHVRAHRLGTHERVRGLDCHDMLVKVFWERPLCCTDEPGPILVLVDREFCIEQARSLLSRNLDANPVLCWTVAKCAAVDPVVLEPGVNEIKSFIVGFDELIYLFGS